MRFWMDRAARPASRRRRLAERFGALILAALLPAGFAHHGAPSASPPPALEVDFSGCGAVVEGPACELPEDGSLRLWVEAGEGARVIVTIDDREVAFEATPIQGGSLVRLGVGASARELAVTAARDGARASFRLPLRPPSAAPAVQRAEALRKGGKLDEAAALLAEPAMAAEPRVRAAAMGTLARIRLAQGRVDEGLAQLEEAAAMNRGAGRLSDALRDELALAHNALYNGRRFSAVRRALDRSRRGLGDHAEGRIRALYYEGLLAYETGDFRSALRSLHESALGSERLALTSYRLAALPIEADILLVLGRMGERESLVREAETLSAAAASACERADFLTNVGWIALHARAGGLGAEPAGEGEPPPDLARAGALLERALALYDDACPDRAGRSNALTNMAVLRLHEGKAGEVRHYLDAARREEAAPDARIQAWWLAVEAQLSSRAGDAAAALDAFSRLARLARSALLPIARWQAALGRARALEALGRDAEAGSAYAEAEELLEDHSFLVPAREGRETFLGQFDESARHRVDFLMRRDPAAAAAAARRARARSLAALQWIDRLATLGDDERARWDEAIAAYRAERDALEAEAADAWKLSDIELPAALERRKEREARLAEELDRALTALGHIDAAEAAGARLATPGEGELFLVYRPIRRGWAGFAITRGGVEARALPDLDPAASPAALAQQLLSPFRDALATAARVRIFADGELDRIDFHALPWGDGPLLAALPVTYGVDLPRLPRAVEAQAGSPARRALVVADPRNDLPAARDEAQVVSSALERQGQWQIERIDGAAATHRAVRAALERGALDLLHYTGHGFFGGRDGWESGLPLAGGDALTVSDILTLPRAPDRVVLSGCETARTAAAGRTEGLGLAQAFVVVGAGAVVAATRRVDDRLAARIMAAFYASPPGPGPDDAAERLRAAELELMRAAPDSDWPSFRLLVP